MIELKYIYTWEKNKSSLWIYGIALIFLLLIYLQRNYIRLLKIAFTLDGFPALPLLGNIYCLFDQNSVSKIKDYSMHKMIRFWMTVIPYILIIQPECIQKVISGSKNIDKPYVYSLFRNFIGKGLLSNGGETYKFHHKVLHKAFSLSRLEKFNKIYLKHTESFVSTLRENVNQNINITKFVNDTVYKIQAESILNLKWAENEEISFFPYKTNKMNADYRLKRPWLILKSLYGLTKLSNVEDVQLNINYTYCNNIIKKIEESKRLNDNSDSITNDEDKNVSIIEYMVDMKQNYPNFNNKDILDEIGSFMLAGLESISTTTAFTLFHLANYPEWQEKCVEEINEIFNDSGTITSINSFKRMTNLEMCIKETLRLYPPVPLLGRILSEDTEIDGKILPVDSTIIVSPYLTHRIPTIYPDPESFKPERFDPNNPHKIHPYAFIPFSVGFRKCMGYKFAMIEMKAILSSVLQTFILEPVENKDKINIKYRMTTRASGGIWVKFRLRQAT